MRIPNKKLNATPTIPIERDILEPYIVREKISLPRESVPKICFEEGGAGCRNLSILSPTFASGL